MFAGAPGTPPQLVTRGIRRSELFSGKSWGAVYPSAARLSRSTSPSPGMNPSEPCRMPTVNSLTTLGLTTRTQLADQPLSL
jgi:hypothetical protein